MTFVEILLIAIGLAMDAFAVSISCGLAVKQSRLNNALKIGIFFGGFQAGMPVIGWLLGVRLRNFICSVDHWIAFGLLLLIGCRMIYEAFKSREKKMDFLDTHVLLLLSVATSIDALAVGVSFAFLDIFIVTPIIVIGIVTFILSFSGVFTATKFGQFFKNKIEIAGGLILIGIGIKILVEHLL